MGILGWPLGWIMWAIYSLVKNYGVALILFTVLVKVATFPLSIKQQKSTARMSVFQPKINEIQKKYANNKQKQQEEMAKFYQEHQFNPMSGCLPLLVTFLVLFGVIDVVYKPLTHILHLDSETIALASDVVTNTLGQTVRQIELQIISAIQGGQFDTFASVIGTETTQMIADFKYSLFGLYLGQTPTLAFNVLLLVPILSGLTSFLSGYVSMKMSGTAQSQGAGMMKGMIYMMPLMSVWITVSVPIGVGLYWILSNLLAMLQSILMNKLYSPAKYKAEYEAALEAEKEKKRLEREKRRKASGGKLKEEESKDEEDEEEEKTPKKTALPIDEEGISEKERNRRRLAEARRRDAEKYGEEYIEVNDNDLR